MGWINNLQLVQTPSCMRALQALAIISTRNRMKNEGAGGQLELHQLEKHPCSEVNLAYIKQ